MEHFIRTKFDYRTDANAEPPVMHEVALYGFGKRFVKLACRNSDAQPGTVYGGFLVRVASEASARTKLRIGEDSQFARLYGVAVGPTGRGRKGTSNKAIKSLFQGIGEIPEFNYANVLPDVPSSKEGLIMELKDYGTDTAGGGTFIANKNLFLILEEFMELLTGNGKKLHSTWVRCYDDASFSLRTKQERIVAEQVHITLWGEITAEELTYRINPVALFNGFANRFQWIYSESTRMTGRPLPMPDEELIPMRLELFDILKWAKDVEDMQLTETSWQVWADHICPYFDKFFENPRALIRAISARAPSQVLRTAMILALLDRTNLIDVPHLQAALAWWDYCRQSAEFVFSPLDKTSSRIMEQGGYQPRDNRTPDIRRMLAAGTKQSEIATSLNVSKARVSQVKKMMEEEGLVLAEEESDS